MAVWRRGLGVAAACWIAAVAAFACTSQLDISIACGDGYVDREAREECDPDDPDRAFESACDEIGLPDGTARCDAATCRIDTSGCDPCGNGMVETKRGEECDPEDASEDYSTTRHCAGDAAGEHRLTSPYGDRKPQAAGDYKGCDGESCRWSRAGCNYCGDGIVDGKLFIDVSGEQPVSSLPEVCDGDAIPDSALKETSSYATCASVEVGDPPMTTDDLRPNVTCSELCDAVHEPVADSGEITDQCCVRAGRACPDTSDLGAVGFRCCYELAHPGENPCTTPVLEGGKIGVSVCRPFDGAGD